MRIVITKLGKNEIKEVDYEEIPKYNHMNQKNNIRAASYNKNQSHMSIYDNNIISKQRNNKSIQQKIEYDQFPTTNRDNKNVKTSSNNSFLSKIGELSIKKTKEFKTPDKSRQNLELNNNIPLLKNQSRNQNTLFTLNTNNSGSAFRKIKLNPKKLNIPVVIFDQYSKGLNDKNNNNNLDSSNNNEELKINDTKKNLILDKNKMYSLREILLPKNQKNVDEFLLDKKINSNGGESIINYLQMDKDISPSLIEKINKSNNEQLYKLDKICQKYFNDEKIKNDLDIEIKEKIKKEYEQDSIYCKKKLNNMGKNLKNYNNVYKRLRLKKDKYESYKNLYLSHKE